ncbi:MAG: N-acetylmuramoyl-L-alanine amidase [Legionellales bacterium]|nr:N-acetylmuramoyl-L-alanine amidase [Legionellales bacterium]
MRALLFLMLIHSSWAAMASQMDALWVKEDSQKTSVMMTLSGVLKYKAFILSHPDRLVVDLNQTKTAVQLSRVMLGHDLILSVRRGAPDPKTVRLVFDLRRPVRLSTHVDSAHQGWVGLQLDLISKTGAPPSTPHPSKIPIRVQHTPPKSLRDVIIVLDPGHGGKDPGAIGPRHIAEKVVVLAIAQKLKQLIDKEPGMHAVLTRQGDYYVGLRERLTIARRYKGDVFISIHADAFINHHSNGASVYALSQTGATSEAARWLAEKENNSELGGVNLSNLDDQSGLIRTVLLDLSQTATITSSVTMGDEVLHHIDKVTALHHHSVEQARFVVLKSPDIPSILVETGFITNSQEERNLNNPNYQSRLTQAMVSGIKRYFWDYPPHGTRLEARNTSNWHIVRNGETLPTIAARYQVSLSALKSINHLTKDRLSVGQKLSIPTSLA